MITTNDEVTVQQFKDKVANLIFSGKNIDLDALSISNIQRYLRKTTTRFRIVSAHLRRLEGRHTPYGRRKRSELALELKALDELRSLFVSKLQLKRELSKKPPLLDETPEQQVHAKKPKTKPKLSANFKNGESVSFASSQRNESTGGNKTQSIASKDKENTALSPIVKKNRLNAYKKIKRLQKELFEVRRAISSLGESNSNQNSPILHDLLAREKILEILITEIIFNSQLKGGTINSTLTIEDKRRRIIQLETNLNIAKKRIAELTDKDNLNPDDQYLLSFFKREVQRIEKLLSYTWSLKPVDNQYLKQY
ncbi:MAG: hypothetical protein QXW70_03860 [Candidatus Anstonellales archaeon]